MLTTTPSHLPIIVYLQQRHIRVSVIPILVTTEELAVRLVQDSHAHVHQITLAFCVKVNYI